MNATRDKLYEIARTQGGLFTAKQAIEAGYSSKNFHYHLKRGSWKKEMRGIYRLTRFPLSDYWQYIVWYLWAHNAQGVPEGVFSHETALELYGLSDISADQIHMTVPKSFRRSSAIPKIVELHKQDLLEDEMEFFHCFQVTTPCKTLLDIASSQSIARDHLAQAVVESVDRGLVSRAFIQEQSIFGCLKSSIPRVFE